MLAPAIIYGANTWLKKQGIDSEIEDINIDIFNGQISLINITAEKEAKKIFNADLLELYWQWSPLSDKTIAISKIKLEKLETNIEHYDDALIINGVRLPLNSNTDEDKGNDPETVWTVSLDEIEITDTRLCYFQQAISVTEKTNNSKQQDKQYNYCLGVGRLSWQGPLQYLSDTESADNKNRINAKGKFLLKDFNIIDNNKNKQLFAAQSISLPKININDINDISIPKLAIKNLSALQRKHGSTDKNVDKNTVHFDALTIDNLNFITLNNFSIQNIIFNKPSLYLLKNNADTWEHQAWLPASATSNNAPSKTDSTFNFSINDLTVTDSNFCYLEQAQSLNYCFTAENVQWLGSTQIKSTSQSKPLAVTANASLSLTQARINNQTDNRNLARASALKISNITVKNINDFSLSDFSAENFGALQRSDKTDDTSASFDKLRINSIDYSIDSIAIDQINIDGLGATISKNKSGGWEHDKWLPNKKQVASTSNVDTQKQNNTSLAFSLNQLTISSKNKITYVDESTLPVTNIGLQNLNFTIDELNTSNITSASPFSLFAKTIEHSTIELKGKIKPFADKLSLNAKGELKGYDLRSVSALTKKSVGHVIKSGQVDADLELKITDDILDSNISLSLFQFEIKPVAKADADKLDKLFGMPLNQTLTLLRDRNDNIHLKIPITGNINKPNFDPMDAIIKATSKAATVTLITFYTPYGLVYAGSNALFNIATALDFEPVFFDAGTSELILPVLNEDGEDQLLNLIKLMDDKSKVHLTLCGKTNQSDLIALFPKAINKPSKAQRDALYQLASKRQINVKNYLIEQGGLAHDRLILCAPEHVADEDAIAGVEINI
jgi:hypothetical protein